VLPQKHEWLSRIWIATLNLSQRRPPRAPGPRKTIGAGHAGIRLHFREVYSNGGFGVSWLFLPVPWTVRRPPVPAVLAQAGQADSVGQGHITHLPGLHYAVANPLREERPLGTDRNLLGASLI
jgi:hypothetical protein